MKKLNKPMKFGKPNVRETPGKPPRVTTPGPAHLEGEADKSKAKITVAPPMRDRWGNPL